MPKDQVFISYSHKDKKWLGELETHLKPYLRNRTITSWSDQQIAPGSEWFTEIQVALANSKIAVLLVSPDFFASDFIHEHELGPLLKKADQDGVKILWLPVRDSAYKQTPLSNYHAVIDPVKPLAQNSKRDEAWVKTAASRAVNHRWIRQLGAPRRYRKDDAPVWYTFPDGDKRLLYIAHIDVRNSRPDIAAPDCEIQLVRIYSPTLGERPSPDQNPLKVRTRAAYSQRIWPEDCRTFDVFGIDANSYANTQLLNESDVPRSRWFTPEACLTYESSHLDSKVDQGNRVGFGGERPHLDEATRYYPSGYNQGSAIFTISFVKKKNHAMPFQARIRARHDRLT